MDRDYTIFKNWQEYLAPLGAKQIRLQAGWAKCEKEKGVYNFEWLDKIVDGVLASGVESWLQTSYGNALYGGEAKLGGGDGLYGHNRQLTKGLDKRGKLYVLDVHKDELVYLEKPHITQPKEKQRKDREAEKLRADIGPIQG